MKEEVPLLTPLLRGRGSGDKVNSAIFFVNARAFFRGGYGGALLFSLTPTLLLPSLPRPGRCAQLCPVQGIAAPLQLHFLGRPRVGHHLCGEQRLNAALNTILSTRPL
jgi:hypothetical protein